MNNCFTSINNSDRQMLRVADEFVVTGTESVVEMLVWALLIMATNQDHQKHVHEEILKVIGKKSPSMADRNKLTYTEAVLHEIYRYSSFILFVIRRSTEQFQVNGFDVPENAIVYANLYATNRDPKIWQDPEKFNPENFLERGTNKKIVNTEYIIPYSLGILI